MKSFIKMCTVLSLAIAYMQGAAYAQQQTVTLQQLISEMLKNNPDLQAAESRAQAAEARPSQMRTPPDPVISFVSRNGNGNPVPFTELGEDMLSSVGFMWEQEFPFPGKLRLAAEVAEKEAAVTRTDIATVRWNRIAELKKAYYEYFQVDRSIAILSESLSLLKRFEEIARARYSVGEGIQQDVLRSQVEISILDQRLTSMKQERASAAAEINQLLNRPVNAPLPAPAEVQPSQLSLDAESLQNEFGLQAPQIRTAELMVEREQKMVELAKKEYRPDFMTTVEYANSPNFPDMWEIQFGLRIPIFYKRRQANREAEARHNLTRAQKELQGMKQEIAFKLNNELLQIEASEKLLKLYNQAILPQTNLALESSLATYQVGKSDFLTTLTNFMTLLEYRMNYYEELARHETSISRLERALGREVEVRVDLKSSPSDSTGGNNE